MCVGVLATEDTASAEFPTLLSARSSASTAEPTSEPTTAAWTDHGYVAEPSAAVSHAMRFVLGPDALEGRVAGRCPPLRGAVRDGWDQPNTNVWFAARPPITEVAVIVPPAVGWAAVGAFFNRKS